MKKILAIALALVMMLSCAVFASAEETTLPDMDCADWWLTTSDGIELTAEGVTITLTNTTKADAPGNWDGLLWYLYTGSAANVGCEGYVEYWIHRGDNYGWCDDVDYYGVALNRWSPAEDLAAKGISFSNFFEAGFNWDNFLPAMKAGAEAYITAKLDGTNAVITTSVGGVTNIATLPVDTSKPVYLSLGGEQTNLTNIKVNAGISMVNLQLCQDFSTFWPNSYYQIGVPFQGAGTYTLSLDLQQSFGAGLNNPAHLYVEIPGAWADYQNLVVSDLKINANGTDLAVDMSKVYTYEGQTTTDWVTYFGTNAYIIEINNTLGMSATGGSCIDMANFNAQTLEITFTLSEPAAEIEAPFADEDNVKIYFPKNESYISATANDNGKKLLEADADNAAIFTVEETENGYYFICGGKYLTAGATGNSLTLEETANEYSLWVLEAAENGWFVKNVNAAYNEQPQYLEFYSGFTTYGKKDTADVTLYTYQFEVVEDSNVESGDAIFAVLAVMAASGLGLTAVVSKKK